MLSEVKRIIAEGHLGVRTYEKFVQACLQQAAEGNEETVALFVFARLTQPFIDYYSDQALSDARANEFRHALLASLAAYEAADGLDARQEVLCVAIRTHLADSTTGG